jgi:tetratricopeptide (TPR) repeat protein
MKDDRNVRVFISCVSDEFRSYRDQLRGDLTRHNVEVKVQEDFIDFGTVTLDMLDHYIANCHVIVHLVGDMTGSMANPESVKTICDRYADLSEKLAPLGRTLADNVALSYTQWEAWLALYHGKTLLIAAPDPAAPRGPRFSPDAVSTALQAAHLARLREKERYPRQFKSVDDLAKQIAYTSILDMLAAANRPARKPNMLPYAPLGSLFKGRETFVEELRRVLGEPVDGKAVAITGLGGVGKTRLAVEYGHRYAADYNGLFFLSAATPTQLRSHLASLVGPLLLDLPEKSERQDEVKVAAALAWLNANPGWFLILDNVDTEEVAAEAEALTAKLSGGHVLITGRLASFGAGVETFELDVLTVEDATAFLLERTKRKRAIGADDEEHARQIAKELGQLALGLEQAGAYVDSKRISFADYLKLWRETRDKALEEFDRRVMKYPKSIAVTWSASVKQLSPDSRRLLDRVAWLAPEPIPESLLEVPTDAAAGTNEARSDARKGLEGLFDYSLATPARPDSGFLAAAGGTRSFTVHRLVQEVTRRNQGDKRPEALQEALQWLDRAFDGDPYDVSTWPVLEPLASHVKTLVGFADQRTIPEPTWELMGRLSGLFYGKADYHEAEPLLRRSLAICEASLGPDHPDVATALNNLALLLRDTNRLGEVESLLRRALAIYEASFGPDHPHVATALTNLAWLLKATNRLAEAEPLLRRSLAIREASFGPDHPDVVHSLNNLALLLQATNRLGEAEPLCRRAGLISSGTI